MSGDRWAKHPVTKGGAPDADECERCDRADDVIDRIDYYITALIHEPALTEREAGIVHALADILQDRP